MSSSHADHHEEIESLVARLAEAEETLRAIRHGEIDALVVESADGHQVYTLHGAEEPYRNLVEQMQEGAVVLTKGRDILYCNARFAELVGEPSEAVVGSRFDRFIGAPSRHDFDSMLDSGNGRCRGTLIQARSDAIEVSLSLTTTASTGGERLNLIVTDLSDLLEASGKRDRAERDNRAKDDFQVMLAHELRNPLSAIASAVGVLEATQEEGSPATRAHQVIARQVDHMSRLINELLDVERVASGRFTLNRAPLDMAQAVRQGVAAVAGDGRLDRDIEVDTEPVWVDGDAFRLEQVLTNLVTNAVKYTSSGDRIRVTLRAEGGDAVLSVEDTGAGISPMLLPAIFDLYVQADRTLNRSRGGLGIGLALVRRLVALHGGTVEAASDGEGCGARFTVRLGRIPSPGESSGLSYPMERRANPRSVLLIENSGDAREMLRAQLELAGHNVYDAEDGARGLELVKAVQPEVGIIDISVASLDGCRIAKQIRDDPHGRDMLLVALTERDPADDSTPSSAHAFDYHLGKPVDADRLARLIGEVA